MSKSTDETESTEATATEAETAAPAPRLTDVLRGINEREFWADREKTRPAYSRVFAAAVRALFVDHLESADTLLEAIGKGDMLNMSSFQRAVAKEAEARKGGSRSKEKSKKSALLGAAKKRAGKSKKGASKLLT